MTLMLHGLSKRYGGLKAVDDVSFVAAAARVTALIGPNGAGKTTLLNLISGIVPSDSGYVTLEGQAIAGLTPAAIAKRGLARTFQSPQLFEGMTVLETVMVGAYRFAHLGLGQLLARLPGVSGQERDLEARAEAALRYVRLAPELYDRVALELPYGLQRQVEIARAIAMDAKAVLLDEPAAGLNNRETAEVSELINRMREDGLCVILIEHDMEMVMNLSDHVVVLNFGRKLAEGCPNTVRGDRRVIEAYLGTDH